MKSDMQIQKDVIEELRWDPAIKEREIGVATRDGVVTLTGRVGSYAERWAAERATERVTGVQAIADELEVHLPSEHVHSDTELAHRIVEAMRWDVLVPDDKVTAKVSNGWLTLAGEVEWQYQRDAAMRAVRSLTGLRGVTNMLSVKPRPVTAYDVTRKIKEALRRRAEREAESISVETDRDVVTLRGTVPTFADRRAIEGAAWAAPGVREVKDELVIGT